MPFGIIRDDITHVTADAIVNAANGWLRMGGGVCGAIFAAAGAKELQRACDELAPVATGCSVATPAFGLKARHIIHTVGPVWRGGTHDEESDLRSCYRSALSLAQSLGDASIAFPLVSSGIYGYPKDKAIDVALEEIRAFLDTSEMDVTLVLFDADAHREASLRFPHIAARIDDLYVRRSPYLRRDRWERPFANKTPIPPEDAMPSYERSLEAREAVPPAMADASRPLEAAPGSASGARSGQARNARTRDGRPTGLKRLLQRLDASFSTTLLHMIDERGLKDSEVYKRANMSRQHFSKIRSNPSYRPKKHTVLALCVALELSLDDTRLLLERAGFALTHADERDIIVEYFIEHRQYDIYQINLALYSFDQPLLG